MQLFTQYSKYLTSSPIKKRLFTAILWSVVGEGCSKGLLLIAMVFIARILGKEDYGQFGMIRTTINLFATVGGMGLGLTANRFVAQFRNTDKEHSGRIIGASFILAIATGLSVGVSVFIGSEYLASIALNAPQLKGALKIAGLLLFLGALNGAQIGVLQGLEAYRLLALGSFFQGVTAIISLVVGSYYFGLDGTLIGFLAYTLFGVLCFHLLINRELIVQNIAVRFTDIVKTLPIFWKFSVPVVLMGIAVAPFKWLAERMLMKSVGFQELGIFYASMTIATIFIAIVSTLNAPLISLVADIKDLKITYKIEYLNLYGSWYLFLLIALPYILFPKTAFLLFGDQYDMPKFYIMNLLLILYSALLLYYQGVMRLVAHNGSMWLGVITNLFEGISLIGAFYLLIDQGGVGFAIAHVLSYVIRVAISIPLLIRYRVIPGYLLYDKYFIITLTALLLVVVLQIGAIA